MDQMPRALCDAIEVTRAALYARSTHALTASDCSLIYVALDSEGATVGYRARTRLAIQAARDALLHAAFRLTAWNVLPEREIALATQVVEGLLRPDAPDVRAHIEAGFPGSVAPWLGDPVFVAAFTLKVQAAFRAAHLALLQAVAATPAGQDTEASRRSTLERAGLPQIGSNDPALLASVAVSWDERVGTCDATALLRFWEDWLIFSVPAAWRAAHRALRSDRARTVAPTYQLRFFFEWGVDSCLWPTTKEAWEVFDNPADLERLPLSPETTAQVRHLCTWYQGALNWEYPPDPGPWRQEECDRFNCASASLLEALRRELGGRFEVIGEPYDLREDPRLDEYLGDPRTYHHKRGINH